MAVVAMDGGVVEVAVEREVVLRTFHVFATLGL